jgi:hypothetical protein
MGDAMKTLTIDKKKLLKIAKELKGGGRAIDGFDRMYRRGVDDLLRSILNEAEARNG